MVWPATKVDVEVSLALGADVAADPDTWAWTVLPDLAYVRDPITITRGRGDEQSDAGPAKATVTLDNRDGRFVPRNPLGPYFGQLGRNTPLRIRTNAGTPGGLDTRFVGFVSEWPTRWDVAEVDHHVRVEAHGTLRRLSTGRQRSPLRSALQRAILASDPAAYWPMEDGNAATASASAVGGPLLRPTAPAAGGAQLVAPGSAGGWTFASGGRVQAPTGQRASSAPNGWDLELAVGWDELPSIPTGEQRTVAHARATGSAGIIGVGIGKSVNGNTYWTVYEFDAAGGGTFTILSGGSEVVAGRTYHVRLTADQVGSDIEFAVYADGVTAFVDGSGGVTLRMPTEVQVNTAVFAHTPANPSTLSHLAFWSSARVDPVTFVAAAGHVGELAGARFTRLCEEEGIAADVAGVDLDSYAMGPQRPVKLLELLRQCEAAGAGVMYDRRTGELGLDLLTARENRPPSLILDYAAGHVSPPLEPTPDDQLTVNDVTVTADGASTGRVIDELGPLGVTEVGRYDAQHTMSLDPNNPDLPVHHAGWRVNLGTVDEARYPTVAVDLRANAALVDQATALDVSSRIVLANLTDFISYDDVDLVVEGYTEKLHPFAWTLAFNCAPYAPYLVAVLAEDSMFMLTAKTTTNTSFRVASDPPFTTDAADLPVALRSDGEVVSATGVVNVAVAQAVGTPVHADNAAVQPVLPSHVEGDVLLVFCAIRSSGVGTVSVAGYTLQDIGGSSHCRLFAKYATSAAETDPTVTPAGGAAGDTVSAVAIRVRGIQLPALNAKAQLNGSAQDITYPVYVVEGDLQTFLFCWKQDDYTSVAPGSGLTEVVEGSSTAGNDQSLYVARGLALSDSVPIPAGSLVVTGGAAAISRAHFVTFLRGVVDMTVTRSVNGVVTTHDQLADVEIDQPAILGL